MKKNLYAFSTMKNEEDRYLEACLKYHQDLFDGWYILDDQSDDNSFEIAEQYAIVERRPDHIPSFLEHEGAFRQHSWERMEHYLQPGKSDWIVMIDLDEFFYPKSAFKKYVTEDIEPVYDGVEVHIREVFGSTEDGNILCRIDGYWDQLRQVRTNRYKSTSGGFKNRMKPHACGPPFYQTKTARSPKELGIVQYHLGYYNSDDVQSKYERYSSRGGFGHNVDHINSIIEEPELDEVDLKISEFLP